MKQQRIAHAWFAQRTTARWLRAGALCALSGMFALGALAPIARAQTLIPTVLFNGASQTFTIANVATSTDSAGATVPDLFTALKGIVPGDRITQEITLSVTNVPANQEVTIYLQAMSENDDYNALLESADLSVVHDGDEITQSLAKPIALGVFSASQTQETAVTLSVPITAGNEVGGLSASVDWVFTAQITPESTSTTPDDNDNTTKPPQTGDSSNLYWWIALACLGGVGLVICAKRRQP